MAVALHSYKIDPDGIIRVRHTFYGATEAEAERLKAAHADGCKSYGPAVEAEQTEDVLVEDVERPIPGEVEDYDGDIADDGEDDDDAGELGGEGGE